VISFHAFLTSALDGGELSVLCVSRYTPGGKNSRFSLCIGGWVGPTVSLGAVASKESPFRTRDTDFSTFHRYPLVDWKLYSITDVYCVVS
jgi:hypothetical protein